MGRTRTRTHRHSRDENGREALAPPVTAARTPVVAPHRAALELQRQVGNRATAAVLQRMPTDTKVRETLGKPKVRSSKYRAVLKALAEYNAYVTKNTIGATPQQITEDLKQVMTRLDAIIVACAKYGTGGDTKAEYFFRLKLQAQNEKSTALAVLIPKIARPVDYLSVSGPARPRLINVLGATDPLEMNEARHLGSAGGDASRLEKYGVADAPASHRYFKQNSATLPVLTPEIEAELTTRMDGTGPDGRAAADELNLRGMYSNLSERGGISATDTRSAAREVASSRLDLLLDAGLIARTQFALRNVDGVVTLGSVAKGGAGRAATDRMAARDATDRAALGPDAFDVQDPKLQRALSGLQLLDTLAMQVDRHPGNYFIDLAPDGSVRRVTGIDNDMSFGTTTEITGTVLNFPGMSRYVDKEMAQKIIALDPKLLALAMSDLLVPAEIEALLTRLSRLKDHLVKLLREGKLLAPAQWDAAAAQGILDENRSYTAVQATRARNGRRGY